MTIMKIQIFQDRNGFDTAFELLQCIGMLVEENNSYTVPHQWLRFRLY